MVQKRFRVRGAALVLLLGGVAACGDDPKPGPSTDPARFIGKWNITTGTVKLNCPSLPATLRELTQQIMDESVIVTAGTDAPLVADWRGCKVTMDPLGDVATARANQNCSFMFQVPNLGGVMGNVIVSAATLKLTGATTGDFTQAGAGALTITMPLPFASACSYDVKSSATKLP